MGEPGAAGAAPTMRALVFEGVRRLRYATDAPKPSLAGPGDALVRVRAAAICGSDLHPFRGDEAGIQPGTVVGHEFVGVVDALGPEVVGLAVGDRVMAPFTCCCGACFYCDKGKTCRCSHPDARVFGWVQDGAGLHGGQAEYVRVPLASSTLVKVPDDVTDEEALLLGDILSTAFFCADQGGVSPGDAVAVVGAGPVGLLAVLAARERGAAYVIAVDGVEGRRAKALELGADAAAPPGPAAAAAAAAATGGRGVDVALECVGAGGAVRAAFELVRPAGVVSSIGVQVAKEFPFSPAEAYDKNITLRFGRCPARAYMERLLPVVRARRWPFTSIITHRMPLSRGVEAYAMFEERRDGVIKVVLDPSA